MQLPMEQLQQQKQQQPRALKFFFLTEAWERFAYFAVQSILVLFMSKGLGYGDGQAYLLFSAFGALLFVMPLIGGYLADRFFGYIHTIILGVALLSVGYLLLAESNVNHEFLFVALAILIVGNGCFKPNISTLLGCMYESASQHREIGFMIFYLGINIGATCGVILCGFLAKSLGWSWAIATAGIGLLIGGTTFLLSKKSIVKDILCENKIAHGNNTKIKMASVYAILMVLLLIVWLLMTHAGIVSVSVIACAILLLLYLGVVWFRCDATERNKFFVCIVLVIFSVAFWALYQQSFMSVVLFLSRLVDLRVFGVDIPPSVVGSLNGIFLIILTPLVIKFCKLLQRFNTEPNVVIKFVFGIGFMGVGYLIMYFDARIAVTTSKLAPMLPIVFSYALQTLGELLLSPVGLAMITVLAPQKMRGFMMGVWFFSLAAATALAGQLARFTGDASNLAKPMSAVIYSNAFLLYGASAITIAILLFFNAKKLWQLIR